MKKAYFCLVHLAVNADNEAEACDAVSALLTETGMMSGPNCEPPTLIDWQYDYRDGRYAHPKLVLLPDDYDEELGLHDFIPKDHGR
jgi:hypothetical protein